MDEKKNNNKMNQNFEYYEIINNIKICLLREFKKKKKKFRVCEVSREKK